MADSPAVQHKASSATDRHTLTERCNGTLVSDAFPNASNLQQPVGLQRVVLQPLQLKYQPKLITQHQRRTEAVVNLETLSSSKDEA